MLTDANIDHTNGNMVVSTADQQVSDQSALLHRSFNYRPATVTSASNLYLDLNDGSQVLDACGGAAVSCLGYDSQYVKEITDAVANQLQAVAYVHTLAYTTSVSEQLAAHLLSHPDGSGRANPWGLEKAYFIGSGSEAMDSALKFARQYWYELGRHEKVHYVSRRQSYHGNTVGPLSVSYNVPRKLPYVAQNVLQLQNVSWVGPAFKYHNINWKDDESEEAFSQRLIREIEDEFLRVGPEKVVAFIAEPVVGATSACTPAPKGYFKGVRALCDKYDVLLLLDEIMCGTGRTGTFFAFEQEGIVPDLLTLGKGLGGGFAPIAAVVLGQKVVKGLKSGSGDIANGHTYQAHPVTSAAALAVQRIIRRDSLVQRASIAGAFLERTLKKELGTKKYVGDIRGRGLFWGVEFVKNKETRESFDPKWAFGPRFHGRVFKKGVAVYPGAGTVDGTNGDHCLVTPAYIVTEDQIKKIVGVMREVYEEMEREVHGGTLLLGENPDFSSA